MDTSKAFLYLQAIVAFVLFGTIPGQYDKPAGTPGPLLETGTVPVKPGRMKLFEYFLQPSLPKDVAQNLLRTDVRIPENMIVDIPIWSLHMDPEYWEEPLSFRPERFLPENKDNVNHYAYLPFGLGPRNCVGMRFAQLEVKLVMAKLCLEFEMTLRPGFTEMVLAKTVAALRPNKDGVQLVLKKITNPLCLST